MDFIKLVNKTLVGLRVQVFYNSYIVKYPNTNHSYTNQSYSFSREMPFDFISNIQELFQEKIEAEVVEVFLKSWDCDECSTSYEQMFVKVKTIGIDREIPPIHLDLTDNLKLIKP